MDIDYYLNPKLETTHYFTIPKGTILKSRGTSKDIILTHDLEVNIKAEQAIIKDTVINLNRCFVIDGISSFEIVKE